MDSLPIDPILPEVVAVLHRRPCVVVRAPTGAGKTTRLPPALLDAGIAENRRIFVLEPRRVAVAPPLAAWPWNEAAASARKSVIKCASTNSAARGRASSS